MSLTLLRYILPLGLILVFGLFLFWFFKAPNAIPDNAKATVTAWVKAKQDSDFAILQKIYGKNTIIKTDYLTANGTIIKTDKITSSKFIKRVKERVISKQSIEISDPQYKWADNKKHIIVSSTIYHLNTGQKTPHVLVLSSNRKKLWFIIEEYNVDLIEN